VHELRAAVTMKSHTAVFGLKNIVVSTLILNVHFVSVLETSEGIHFIPYLNHLTGIYYITSQLNI